MPRRLVIYETTHHETLPAMLDLSGKYFDGVTVFLGDISYQNICGTPEAEKWRDVLFVRQSADCSNRAFIYEARCYALENGCTHFHISTLDNNLLYFALQLLAMRRIHLSMSVQAVNEYKIFKYGDLRNITESLSKIFFHRRIRQYRVFFPAMGDALVRYFPRARAVFIPSRFFTGKPPERPAGEPVFRIVIPGTVSPYRRDYSSVIVFVRDYLPGLAAEKPVELVLLGNIGSDYGLKIMKELEAYASDRLHFLFYPGNIPQSIFEQTLKTADLIWSPIHINTRGRRGTAEVYGRSMATGLLADLLLTCCPALVPAGFDVPEHYQEVLISYDSLQSLADRIGGFLRGVDEGRIHRICQTLSFLSPDNFDAAFRDLFSLTAEGSVIDPEGISVSLQRDE